MIDPSVFSNMLSAQEGMFKAYKKALLVKEDGSPLREEDLKPHNSYIFFYPYASTPCYLINLGEEVKPVDVKLKDGKTYKWQGGSRKQKGHSGILRHLRPPMELSHKAVFLYKLLSSRQTLLKLQKNLV
jgi:hypothetical protein